MKRVSLILNDIQKLSNVKIINDTLFKPIEQVSTDTRTIKDGALFVALKGNRFDGHDYVNDAIEKGAKAVVISNEFLSHFQNKNITVISVPDTTTALGELAGLWRKKLRAKVIGITGSNGKTSTKDILTVLLQKMYMTVGTSGNNNNHIGVPLTILSANTDTEMLVLEMGTNHFGEIAYTASIALPDYALITNIGQSHLEFLRNEEGVLKEKKALFDVTRKNGGVIFLNTDNVYLKKVRKKYSGFLTFGFKAGNKFRAQIKRYDELGRPVIKLQLKRKAISFVSPLYGRENVYNILAASAIAWELGVTENLIRSGILSLKPSKQRMEVLEFEGGIVIDDTYNANPASVKSAIKTLGRIRKYSSKYAILGDMFELGDSAEEYHTAIAGYCSKYSDMQFLLLGELMKNLHKALKAEGMNSRYFDSREKLQDFLSSKKFRDAVILIKGSRGMKMEQFVKVIVRA